MVSAFTKADADKIADLEPDLVIGFSDVQEPSSSVLSGADVFDSQGFLVLFGVRHRLPFGTAYRVDYNVDRSESNSIFQSLNPAWNNRFTVSVTQPLLRGAGRRVASANLLIAQEGTGAADAAFRARVEQLLLSVERAYWELVFAERDLEVKQTSLSLAREQLDRTQAQVDVGLIAPVQATQAEVAVASRETELILARNALEGARDELRALLRAESLPAGWDTQIVLLDEPRAGSAEVDVGARIAAAIERRPELEQLRAVLRTRGVEVEAARNALLPAVDVVAQISFNGIGGDELVRPFFGGPVTDVIEGGYGDAASQLFSFDFPTWRLGVSFQYPLGNRTARGNYAVATLDEDRARTELERLEQQITLEVRLAARRLTAATDAVATTAKTRQLAERQLEIEQDRFEVGMTTNFEVLEFQDQLSQALSSELRAVIEERLAEAELERVSGGLLERFGIRIR